MRLNALKPKTILFGILLSALIAGFGLLTPFCLDVLQIQKGPLSVQRWLNQTGKTQVTVGPQQPEWVPLDKISLFAVYAVIVAEDARFYTHGGIDFKEIKNSVLLNWRNRKIIRGGSTITQQVVKMAFLSQERTFTRKFKEAIGAFLMEQILTKEEILTWYLNLVPFGEGVYGIGQGAEFYFQTDPELLTVSEAVQLALIIPSPNIRAKFLRSKHLEETTQKRFVTIVYQMLLNGYITNQQWAEAIASGDFGDPIRYSR